MLKKEIYDAVVELVRKKPQLSEDELESWVVRRFGGENLLGWAILNMMVEEGVFAVDEETGKITLAAASSHEENPAS